MGIEKTDRESRLSSFTETYNNEIEDWMKRQETQIIQTYSNLFDDELTQAETYAKTEITSKQQYMHLSLER